MLPLDKTLKVSRQRAAVGGEYSQVLKGRILTTNPDDLGYYNEISEALGKRFRGEIAIYKPSSKPKNITRVYQVVGKSLTHAKVEFRYQGEKVQVWLSWADHHHDSRVRRNRNPLPNFDPTLDKLDAPFSIVRD